ncbi:MAG: glycosyltransferase family 4 protein [Deltaproteobacteria bacterium]|nr:glycosyltransferase family 4 protein [Deltaproteobacteria bacterium]
MGRGIKKIGIVTEYFYPHLGGITEHVYYFSKELARRGFEVVLLTGFKGEELEVELPPSVRIIRLGKSISIFSNNSYGRVTIGTNLGRKIKKVLADEQFDLLHIHSPIMMTLPLLFQKYTNTVTIGTFHTYFDTLFPYKIWRKTSQRYLDKLDGRIAVSQSCIDAMNRYFRGDYTIIPNGVETSWFSTPSGRIQKYDDGSQNILFLGRLDPRNGLNILLDAFPHIERKLPNARLIVVGDGPMRHFFEKRAGTLINRKIFFEGQINGNRPDYFATSHVFCYPATKASFGITLLEAMAAGTPVVAADNPGFKGLIRHGVNGFLVPKDNPPILAEALVKILDEKGLAQKLVEGGRAEAERHSWAKVTDRVIEFYNQIYLQKKGVPFG